MIRFAHTSLTILVLVTFIIQPIMVFATEARLIGIFIWRHGDNQQGQPINRYYLQQGNEELQIGVSEVVLAAAGGARALDGRLVQLEFAPVTARDGDMTAQAVVITPLERAIRPRAVTGAQPWLTIMCKFNDVATEPKDYAYFADMYGSTYPGLNHYWQEVSFNNINIDGSGVAGSGWYTLPQNRAYYVGAYGVEFAQVANDCTAAADADVDFSSYVGINLMFNSDLDGYAWGGSMGMTLDGIEKIWNMTWEPPWGYANISVMAHEMGHGFGLPHSSGRYGQTYDNAWDVMSDAWYNCDNATAYGCIGQHTIAYHKNMLGWIATNKKVRVTGARLLRIDHLAKINPQYYQMATIPVASTSRYFTVEVRKPEGYDAKLPAKAVIIHEVDAARENDAQILDSDLDGDTSDDGAQWVVGEHFVAGNIRVVVVGEYTDGFKVLIRTVERPVVWGNAGVAGATITYTGGSVTADAHGDYAFAVPSGWTGKITPSKSGYTFVPASQTYTNVTSDRGNKNYVAGTKTTTTVPSNGTLDGVVQESTDLNNRGSTMVTTGLLTIGDTSRRQQRRAVLAFDTSAIPDNAVITKVALQLTYASMTGENPFETHGNLLIDVKNGWFGDVNTLHPNDFQATASQMAIGQLRRETTSRYSATWTTGMTKHINKRGETQIRLRFGTKHDSDSTADTINFYDGEATLARRPTLIVEYVAP